MSEAQRRSQPARDKERPAGRDDDPLDPHGDFDNTEHMRGFLEPVLADEYLTRALLGLLPDHMQSAEAVRSALQTFGGAFELLIMLHAAASVDKWPFCIKQAYRKNHNRRIYQACR